MKRELLGIIQKERRRLNRLLTNLLDFARPRPLAFQPTDLGPLIDSVIALVSHTAGRSAITIRKILSASLPAVEIDAEQIKQKDEGEGIPLEDLDKIFDPFFATKDSGAGLGFSVAHQIVSQHGGAIEAQRNPQKGMTFRVVLPIERGRHV